MSEPRHLDHELWRAVLERSPEAAGVRAHLREPCEICESFLATLESDSLDGIVDDALLDPRRVALDELAFERVLKAIDAPRKKLRFGPLVGAIVAIAASVLLFVSISPGPESRLKGEATEATRPIRLDPLKLGADGTLLPLGAHARVVPGDRVVFRVHLERRACIGLWSSRGGATERLLNAPICFSKGDQVIAPGGEVAGLVVEPGPNVTVVVGPLERGSQHPDAPEGPPADQVELIVTTEVP